MSLAYSVKLAYDGNPEVIAAKAQLPGGRQHVWWPAQEDPGQIGQVLHNILINAGKAAVIVQDAVGYQAMLDRLHHMETLAAIQEGMASAEWGELKPAAQVFEEMRARYGLSG